MFQRFEKFLVTIIVFILLAVSASQPVVFAQSAKAAEPKLSQDLLAKLPADLRDAARSHLRLAPAEQTRWLALTPDLLRSAVLGRLAERPALADFLLRLLPREPAARNRVALARAVLQE